MDVHESIPGAVEHRFDWGGADCLTLCPGTKTVMISREEVKTVNLCMVRAKVYGALTPVSLAVSVATNNLLRTRFQWPIVATMPNGPDT